MNRPKLPVLPVLLHESANGLCLIRIIIVVMRSEYGSLSSWGFDVHEYLYLVDTGFRVIQETNTIDNVADISSTEHGNPPLDSLYSLLLVRYQFLVPAVDAVDPAVALGIHLQKKTAIALGAPVRKPWGMDIG